MDALEQAGQAAAQLVLPGSDSWVHRRVQSLRYLESFWTEIRLSVDFDLPSDDAIKWVPISSLPKWPPLFRIDYLDHESRPIPLLTSQQNGAIDFGLMTALSDAADTRWSLDERFNKALESLTRGPETTLDQAFEQLYTFVSKSSDLDDPNVSRFVDVAASLITSTLLWYPVYRADGAPRTIAKVAYHWPDENTDAFWVRASRSMSWSHPTEWLPLPHIGGNANFHLEIEAPPPLMIRSIGEPLFLRLLPPRDQANDEPGVIDETTGDAVQPEQYVACDGHLAHAYVSGPRPGIADIDFSLTTPRSGFVGTSFIASLVIALFVTAMYHYREAVANPENRDGAVALLALVPAIIGYLVARPSDPAVVRRHLIGVQVVVTLAAAIPVTMAVLLLKYGSEPQTLQCFWCVAMVASWLVALMLAFSVACAGPRQPEDDEH